MTGGFHAHGVDDGGVGEAMGINYVTPQDKGALIRRLDEQLPRKGAAPPAPPLPDIPLMWEKGERRVWWRYALTALASAAAGAAALNWLG